jgi:hypothetical protein
MRRKEKIPKHRGSPRLPHPAGRSFPARPGQPQYSTGAAAEIDIANFPRKACRARNPTACPARELRQFSGQAITLTNFLLTVGDIKDCSHKPILCF